MKAQVLLPKIFNFSFTYETKKEKLTPGDIVEVPFGKENGSLFPYQGDHGDAHSFIVCQPHEN